MQSFWNFTIKNKLLLGLGLITSCLYFYYASSAREPYRVLENPQIGGLSGLTSLNQELVSVSDDRFQPKLFFFKANFEETLKVMPINLGQFKHERFDFEGITFLKGHFWLVDEYGPSLVKMNTQGQLLNRYVPRGSKLPGSPSLPTFLLGRKKNRGFEGVTVYQNQIAFMLQAPIPNPKLKKKDQRLNHLFVFDPIEENISGHFLYAMEKSKNKIGSITTYQDSILVLEQNSKDNWKEIYQIKPSSKNLHSTWNDRFLEQKINQIPASHLLAKTEFISKQQINLKAKNKIEGMHTIATELFLLEDNDLKPDHKTKVYKLNLQSH